MCRCYVFGYGVLFLCRNWLLWFGFIMLMFGYVIMVFGECELILR